MSYFFGHVQKVNVRRCDVFRSYSFGHVESVKLLPLGMPTEQQKIQNLLH